MKEMGGGVEPQAIFTDADLAAECAMNQVFPNSDKYRCFCNTHLQAHAGAHVQTRGSHAHTHAAHTLLLLCATAMQVLLASGAEHHQELEGCSGARHGLPHLQIQSRGVCDIAAQDARQVGGRDAGK
jgi:hypothetical protein